MKRFAATIALTAITLIGAAPATVYADDARAAFGYVTNSAGSSNAGNVWHGGWGEYSRRLDDNLWYAFTPTLYTSGGELNTRVVVGPRYFVGDNDAFRPYVQTQVGGDNRTGMYGGWELAWQAGAGVEFPFNRSRAAFRLGLDFDLLDRATLAGRAMGGQRVSSVRDRTRLTIGISAGF